MNQEERERGEKKRRKRGRDKEKGLGCLRDVWGGEADVERKKREIMRDGRKGIRRRKMRREEEGREK